MRATSAYLDGSFGLDRITVGEREVPEPGEGEVLVRVRKASLNYRDLLVATGEYNPNYALPLTLGSDAAGQIEKLGPGTSSGYLRVGDRVCPLLAQGWLSGAPGRDTMRRSLGGPLQGVFAQYVISQADSVVRIPDSMEDLEAACLPCAALTAWSALVTYSALGPGQTLFALGTGGVALFAIQIGKVVGARVLGSTREPAKRARLERLGVEAVVDTSTAWGAAVRELTQGEGADHVLDVGGAATLGESLRAVAPGGTITVIGRFGRGEPVPSLQPVVMRNVKLQGIYVGHRQSLEDLIRTFAERRVQPVIDAVYPLRRVRDALEHLASGRHFGKICLDLEA